MFDMFCFHYQNQCATYEHAQKTLAFFRNNLLFHLAFCGLLWDSSQNDDGHFRFRSEHSACSMHLHLHKYTFETDTTYRIPTVYTCFYFLTHIYYKYIYILCCTCFLKTYIPPSIVFICIYKPSIRPLSFTSTLPPSGKTCVIFVALMASSSCRPHPWHVAPC